jgi:hypothetical protein
MLQTIYLREDFDVNRTKQESALPNSKKATSQSWQAPRRKAGALMMLNRKEICAAIISGEKKKKELCTQLIIFRKKLTNSLKVLMDGAPSPMLCKTCQ